MTKTKPAEVSIQARRNLREAFKGQETISQAGTHVYLYLSAADEDRNSIDKILTSLGLLRIAQRCLIDGETLLGAGADSPYTTPAQRRAWAAGKLQAAIAAIAVAPQIVERFRSLNQKIAILQQQLSYARAETRAAAKFNQIEVPFREPKKSRGTDWLAGDSSDD